MCVPVGGAYNRYERKHPQDENISNVPGRAGQAGQDPAVSQTRILR